MPAGALEAVWCAWQLNWCCWARPARRCRCPAGPGSPPRWSWRGYLKRHGWAGAALARMAGLHTDVTQVGGVAERAGVGELILSHYLPAEPGAVSDQDWAGRAGLGFSGRTTAGRDGLRRMLPRAQGR